MAMTTAQKLRIKAGDVIRLIGTPDDYDRRLGELPAGVRFSDSAQPGTAAVHLFVATTEELAEQFPGLLPELEAADRVWIIYRRRKKYSPGDANRDSIWEYLKSRNWTAVANYAVDGELSAVWAKPADSSPSTA